VTAALVAVGGLTAANAALADEKAEPALTIVAAGTSQTLERTPEGFVREGPGLYAVAGPTPFEIRTKREPKGPKVSATLRAADGTFVPLPDGLVNDVNRLDDFFAYTLTDSSGKVRLRGRSEFCPNHYEPQRARPDAPPKNPYAPWCGGHPYAYGQILGIQAGWSVPLFDWGFLTVPASIKDGNYTVTAAVNAKYRRALGITLEQGRAALKVKIKTVKDDSEGPGVGAGPAGAHAGHGATAPASPAAVAAAKDEPFGINPSPRQAGVQPKPAAAPPTRLLRPAAIDKTGPLPDLRSLPAFGIGLSNEDEDGRPTKKTFLNFGANVWNAGPSPLVVDGFRRPGKNIMDAYQYVFDADGNQVGSAPAGTMEWDPRRGHEHWHFTDFASYRLLDSTRTKAVVSGKESFCLAPTDPIDTTVPGANLKPFTTDLSTACGGKGALSIREILDAGHGDTYYQGLPGQSFDITSIPNGTYYIQVLANPDRKLVERTHGNNSSVRKVFIGGTPGGKRTVKVPNIWGIDLQ
jgi:hypothetical protein